MKRDVRKCSELEKEYRAQEVKREKGWEQREEKGCARTDLFQIVF